MAEGATRPRIRWPLLVGEVLLVLLLAEAVLRLFAPGLHDAATLAAEPRADKLGRYRQRSADDELYYELKPDLDISIVGVRMRTDARGLRVPLEPEPPPAGDALDLVVLGDSTSFGWRVDWERSYPFLVARALERAWSRPVRLTNRSVPGYNSEQELRLLRTQVLADPPDLLLWHVDHNDANAALEPYQAVVLPPDYGDNVLHSALLKTLRRALRAGELSERLHEQQPRERLGGYLTDGPLWQRHLAALQQGARELRAAGLATLFVLFDANVGFDDASRYHVQRLHEPLLAGLAEAGADTLDLYPVLQEAARQRGWNDLVPVWLAANDPHPDPEGHALLAEAISEALHARWPAPPEPR
jgi:lysophospholipase L1-like esterase